MSVSYLSKLSFRRLRGKTVLLRADLNVEPGAEKISFRLQAILPSIKFLLARGARVVILSHRGRPKAGNPKSEIRNPKLTLRPFAAILEKKLGQKVVFVEALSHGIVPQSGKIFLMENLRFWPGEEKNDAAFARRLAALGDLYVNDAFAVSHRKNASVCAITKFLPSYGGLLLEKEVKNLGGILKYTTRPFVIILGGAKASDKLGVIKYFWNKADNFLLGGGPANTFFAAQGLPIGDSLVDRGLTSQILTLIRKEVEPRKIILPLDVKIKNRQILDIGERTILWYSDVIKKSRTVIWNGPIGLFEKKEFSEGTKEIWKAILANRKARIVVGGGETLASLATLIHTDKKTDKHRYPYKSVAIRKNPRLFLSTGGGAMLEFLSGKKLPGIEALK